MWRSLKYYSIDILLNLQLHRLTDDQAFTLKAALSGHNVFYYGPSRHWKVFLRERNFSATWTKRQKCGHYLSHWNFRYTLQRFEKSRPYCPFFLRKPLFRKLAVLPLEEISNVATAIFTYRFFNNMLPSTFDKFFQLNKELHEYNTRGSEKSTWSMGRLIIRNTLLEIRDAIFGINFLSKYYNPKHYKFSRTN